MDYKAFVSSTFVDLKGHRAKAIEALRLGGFHVDPMEEWTADSAEPKQFSQDRLDGCDVCVLLVALRRGFIPEGSDLSITQLEYQAALRLDLDVLVFLLEEQAPWPNQFDELATDPGIAEWRDQLGRDHGVGWFGHEPESLPIQPALTRWINGKAREQAETDDPDHDPAAVASDEDVAETPDQPVAGNQAVTLRFEQASDAGHGAPVLVQATSHRQVIGRGQLDLELDAVQAALAKEGPVPDHKVVRLVDDRTRPWPASLLDQLLPWRRRPVQHSALPSMEVATEVGTALHQALERLPVWGRSTKGGRVRTWPLVINATATPSVAQLPWEFLHDPDTHDFLALNPRTPIVRTLDVGGDTALAPLDVPLRMLVAPARVSGQAELAIDRELDLLEEALVELTGSGRLQLDRLDRTDVANLNDALYRLKPHILHFTGHGGQREDDGFILISGRDGRDAQELSGSQLGSLLRSHGLTQPRLVFLNSCLGAAQSDRSSFAGMAQTMIRRGVPAVVAMQFPIPDDSAVGLAKTFYQALANLEPVETALSAGRSFLHADDDTVATWAAPALYKGRPDVDLFRLADSAATAVTPPAETPPPAPAIRAAATTPVAQQPATETPRRSRAAGWLAAAAVLALSIALAPQVIDLINTAGDEAAVGDGDDDGDGDEADQDTSSSTTTETTTGTSTTGTPPTSATATTTPDTPSPPSAVEFSDDSDVLSAQAEQTLGALAAELQADPTSRVVVAGPPAAVGTDSEQQAIARSRTTVVFDELVELGLDPTRIDVVVGADPFADRGPDGPTDPERTIRIIDGAVAVEPGDSLWAIATELYGDGFQWPRIHEANRTAIADPDLIYPGQILAVPAPG